MKATRTLKFHKNWKGAISLALISILVIAAGLSAYWWLKSDALPQPQTAPSLQVDTVTASTPVTIGLIVSYTEDQTEGAGWDRTAEGAQVAAWRANQNGEKIKIHVVSDKGSEAGAAEAIKELTDNGAAAAVVATSGPHTTALATAAHAQGLPVVFLYDNPGNLEQGKSWTLAPTSEQTHALIQAELSRQGMKNPITIRSTTSTFPNLGSSFTFAPGDPTALNPAETFADLPYDAIVIDGTAQDTATIVGFLRAQQIEVPIFTTSSTQNPFFQDALTEAGASAGNLSSVGEVSADILALSPDTMGAQASNFLHAVEIMSANSQVMSIDQSQPFKNVSAYADVRSHDVVLALAAASEKGNVANGLKSLTQPIEGAITADLSFATPQISSATLATLVQATSTPTRQPLAWFKPYTTQN